MFCYVTDVHCEMINLVEEKEELHWEVFQDHNPRKHPILAALKTMARVTSELMCC